MAEKQQHIDYDFMGGLNKDLSPEQISDNELQEAINIDLTERGGLLRRPGTSIYYEDEKKITQIIKYPRRDGSLDMLAVINDNGNYKLKDITSDMEIAEIDNNNISYFVYQNYLYFIDGNGYFKYDGEKVSDLMLDSQVTFTATLTGDFERGDTIKFVYLITPEYAKLELGDTTNIRPANVLEKGQTIEGMSSGAEAEFIEEIVPDFIENYEDTYNHDFQEDVSEVSRTTFKRHVVFQTIEGQFEEKEEVKAELSNNQYYMFVRDIFVYEGIIVNMIESEQEYVIGIDTSENDLEFLNKYLAPDHEFSKNIDSIGIINELDPPIDLEPIYNCKYVKFHDNSFRFFFAGDSENQSAIYYSEPGNPEIVENISILYPTESIGEVTGLKVIMGYLVVFYENAIWVYTGIDPAEGGEWKKVPTSHGTVSNESVQLTTQSLTTLTNGGIYRLNPNVLGMDADMIPGEEFIREISKNKVSSIIKKIENPEKTTAVFDSKNNKYMLAYDDKIIVYHESLGAFTLYEGLKVNDFMYLNDGRVLMAVDNYILEFDKSKTTDINTSNGNEKSIDLSVKTSSYLFEHPFLEKVIDKLFLSFKNNLNENEESQEINMLLYVDEKEKINEVIKGIKDNQLTIIRKPIRERGDRFYLEFKNNQKCNFEFYGLGFNYKFVKSYSNT